MTAVGLGSPRWLTRPIPDTTDTVLFGLPYTGMGASSYADWPAQIGPAVVAALQPPGREGRIREPAHRTHAAFADDLVTVLAPYTSRRYVLAAHCGAVPYAVQTLRHLEAAGMPPPQFALLSSWGAPHRGLYGRLNHVDLVGLDASAEVAGTARRMGWTPPPDLVEVLADALREDLEIQRGYRYVPDRSLFCPVHVVAWTDDEVVPPTEVRPGWEQCADARYNLLEGDHRAFLRCPPVLR
jgi:surfactin synthase thioesterase subunit